MAILILVAKMRIALTKRHACIVTAILIPILFFFLSCRHRADWLTYRGEQGQGRTANTVYPPFAVKWKLRLQVEDKPVRAFNPPVVLDGTIYFGSSDGNFYALDIASGYMRWVFKTEGAINSVPAADSANIYFGSNDGKAYALSRKDGKELWAFDTGHTVQSNFTRYEDRIVFTSDLGATYFLSQEGVETRQIPNLAWLYHTFQIYKDVMYFAPGPEHRPVSFGAYDINRGVYLWIVDTLGDNATWYSFPALQERRLYYATCGDFGDRWEFVYLALERETGRVLWRYEDDSRLGHYLPAPPHVLFDQNLDLLDYMAPSLWRNRVIFTSGDTEVRAFHSRTGRLVWHRTFDTPTSSAPTVAGDRVYFGLLEGAGYTGDESRSVEGKPPKLVCLSARDGKILWEMHTEGAILSAPVIAGKWLVFGTDRNYFYVLEEVL
jgi:outer membrane protein assembly factor BamB